jgi:hypothetical protein
MAISIKTGLQLRIWRSGGGKLKFSVSFGHSCGSGRRRKGSKLLGEFCRTYLRSVVAVNNLSKNVYLNKAFRLGHFWRLSEKRFCACNTHFYGKCCCNYLFQNCRLIRNPMMLLVKPENFGGLGWGATFVRNIRESRNRHQLR